MRLTKEQRTDIVKTFGTKFGKGPTDSGSAPVQVALLTHRINGLATHFAGNKHDYHSNRGLLKMIGQRKALLKYVQTKDETKYQSLIQDLGLRK
ncbi:MAG: 30S ribosomal protein S15 [Halobacteriovorax sp.]|nr:30S ribosomal protein S15 [Halobacteriovorax sp.]|tara:strand:- start:784 stop:1065 length:282 start_codon:yes stop_codon:yes gene_type:complete